MFGFSPEINKCVESLQLIYNRRSHYVSVNFPIIEILKVFKDREISIKLFYNYDMKLFEIQPPDARYYSRISFYDFRKSERRWVRNRDILFSLILDLKRTGLWDYISNKDFLVVNNYNKKTDIKDLWEDLKKLTENEA